MDPAKVVSVLEGTMNPNLRKEAEDQLDQVKTNIYAKISLIICNKEGDVFFSKISVICWNLDIMFQSFRNQF